MKFIKWILNNIKKLIFFFIKQTVIFIYRTFLLFVLVVGIAYFIYTSFEAQKMAEMNKKYEYVEIDMNREFKEGGQKLIDLLMGDKVSYFDFTQSLKELEKDPKVKGVIFKLDGYSLSSAQTEEISKIVEEISKTKKSYSYSTGFTKNDYSFALSTKEIIMPMTYTSTSNITGYGVEIPFYKKVADKFGVGFTVVHMGDYKSFGENLVSTSMSQYSKENMLSLLNKLYGNFVSKVSEKRGIDKTLLNKKILDGEFAYATPDLLKQINLIDTHKYYSELKKELDPENENIINFDDYRQLKAVQNLNMNTSAKPKNKIGVINLSGNIVEVDEKSKEVITVESFEKMFNKAMADENVKGIVLRVNSPGGSALSSEIIHNMILNGKNSSKKPVYVSMGSVAASGGYYISVAGDKLFANKNSITGSVGVVSIIPNISGLADKVGVNFEILTNGKNTELNSIIQKPSESRLKLMYLSNEKVYSEFKNRVATSRGFTPEEVEAVARGRVWTGEEALNNRMIDGIAGLDEVTILLAKELKIEEAYEVVSISEDDFKGDLQGYFSLLKSGVLIDTFLEMKGFAPLGKILNIDTPIVKNGQLFYAPYVEKIK